MTLVSVSSQLLHANRRKISSKICVIGCKKRNRFKHEGSIHWERSSFLRTFHLLRFNLVTQALHDITQRVIIWIFKFRTVLARIAQRRSTGTLTSRSSMSVIPRRPRRAPRTGVRISCRVDGEGVIEGRGRFEVVNRKATGKNQTLTFLESEFLSNVLLLGLRFTVGWETDYKRNSAREEYSLWMSSCIFKIKPSSMISSFLSNALDIFSEENLLLFFQNYNECCFIWNDCKTSNLYHWISFILLTRYDVLLI